MKINEIYKNIVSKMNFCVGCLSSDRNLKPIIDEDVRTLMFIFLEPPNSIKISAQLCWECFAIIRRIQLFRAQVNAAAVQLTKYKCVRQPLISLSKLSIKHQQKLRPEACCQIEDSEDVKIETDAIKKELEDIPDGADMHNTYTESDEEPLRPRDVTAESLPKVAEYRKEVAKKAQKTGKRRKKKEGTSPGSPKPPAAPARRSRKLAEMDVTHDLIERVVLTPEELEAERLRTVASPGFARLTHRCLPCGVGFNHRAKRDAHRRKHDEAAGPSVCTLCTVRCKDARALAAHRRRHTHRWRCKVCLALWSRPSVAADHAARAHAAPPPRLRCRRCPHRAESLAKLRAHMRSHALGAACHVCGKTFTHRESLRTHLFIHKGEKEHGCPVCGKMFLFKKSMELHAATHEPSAQLYCAACDKTFKNQMSFYGHMKYNLKHIDPARLKHACPQCGRRFAAAARLADHARAVHARSRPLACARPGCGYRGSSRGALRTHARAHAAAPPRRHVCHRCGKTYASARALQAHVSAESGERSLACAVCPARFSRPAALRAHARRRHPPPGGKDSTADASQEATTEAKLVGHASDVAGSCK